jgi:hypothetical protein
VTDDGIIAFAADYVTNSEVGKHVGTSGRWEAERLEFQGHPPLPLASITKLDRCDTTQAVQESLRERKSAGQAKSVSAAFEAAREVSEAVASDMGVDLRRAWNGFADETRGVYLQVVVRRRQRYSSKYVSRFSGHMREHFEAAETGLLALALVNVRSFVLPPWTAARELMSSEAGIGRPSMSTPTPMASRRTSSLPLPSVGIRAGDHLHVGCRTGHRSACQGFVPTAWDWPSFGGLPCAAPRSMAYHPADCGLY